MHKLHKRTFLVIDAGIGLSLATIGASLNLATLKAAPTKTHMPSDSPMLLAQKLEKDDILAAHNKYRLEVGVPSLKWSDSLANSAQKWAEQLASTGSFEHSSSQYGENLWAGTSEAYSQTQMVDDWGDEKQYFIPNSSFPNTCRENWSQCGHYTQIIWKDTQQVGCGLATNKKTKNDYFVCQYNPPGNYEGQKPY
ncbi:MAG TPA: CAP domain-containing protein [Coleofasciculaceae cyanobacterium]